MPLYRFPPDQTEHQFWCKISIYKRENRGVTDVANEFKTGIFDKKTTDGMSNAKKALDFATKIGGSKATTEVLNTIWLFMPTNVTVNDNNIFENTDLATILNAAVSASDKGGIASMFSEDTIKQGMGFVQQYFAQNGGLGGGIAAQAIIKSGQVVNPRTQMLYKGPTLRQLALNWKLMPSSADEARTIENLIKVMRANSYPKLSLEGSFFEFPNIFKLEFMYNTPNGGIEPIHMIQFKELYLQNVTTTYNSAYNVFFEDGNPHEIDLTLNFQETEVITRDDIQNINYDDQGDIESIGGKL